MQPAARREYVKHIAPLVRPGGYVFLECKDKSPDPNTAVLTEGKAGGGLRLVRLELVALGERTCGPKPLFESVCSSPVYNGAHG